MRPERPTVRSGAKDGVVEELQRRLTDEGLEPGPIDGIFGPKTKAALVVFQRACGLEPDGVCGTLTWHALLA